MRLGLTQRKRFVTRACAMLLTAGTLVAAVGCQADMAAIFVDSLESALNTAIPGLMDLLQECIASDGGTAPVGGGNGFLPVV